jgi:hypothetical protein
LNEPIFTDKTADRPPRKMSMTARKLRGSEMAHGAEDHEFGGWHQINIPVIVVANIA